ncbi:FUSC family protein [Sinomonas atrocyanea]
MQAAAADLHRGISIVTSVPNRPVLSRTVQENEPEFVPAAGLVLGQLPGIPSVASEVDPRGAAWNPLTRLQFATRQAVQVAVAGTLAILVGSLISGQRYYWAVIAAFVSFAGTGTRFDTTRKSLLRVAGTLGGLVAGVVVARLTNGNLFAALAVIVASIFCGNYLMRISYAYMIFFLTIMLSELYALLGQFSDELLLLRLDETAAGAAVGIAVALLVTPVSTRDTIKVVQGSVLAAVADLLGTLHDRALDPGSVSADAVDERVIAADNQLRRLVLVGEPLTRYQIWENRPRAIRRRLTLVANIVATARSLSDAASRLRQPDGELAVEIGKVADLARTAAGPNGDGAAPAAVPVLAGEPLDPSARAITQNLPTQAHAALDRLQALLREIA